MRIAAVMRMMHRTILVNHYRWNLSGKAFISPSTIINMLVWDSINDVARSGNLYEVCPVTSQVISNHNLTRSSRSLNRNTLTIAILLGIVSDFRRVCYYH